MLYTSNIYRNQYKTLDWNTAYVSGLFKVLRRVRQLEKKLMNTDSRLPPVREILSRFSAKLSDAQGFLQNAITAIQQTTDQNRANSLKFQRHEVISYMGPVVSQQAS